MSDYARILGVVADHADLPAETVQFMLDTSEGWVAKSGEEKAEIVSEAWEMASATPEFKILCALLSVERMTGEGIQNPTVRSSHGPFVVEVSLDLSDWMKERLA